MALEEYGTMRARVQTGVAMSPQQLTGQIELFDADGNPIDISALVTFVSMFDFTTPPEDGYLLVYDGTKEKFVPLPLSGTGA